VIKKDIFSVYFAKSHVKSSMTIGGYNEQLLRTLLSKTFNDTTVSNMTSADVANQIKWVKTNSKQ
jgi:hypothetical protein